MNAADQKPALSGVIRDHIGVWPGGFLKCMGVCSVLDAKLWVLFMAWKWLDRKL